MPRPILEKIRDQIHAATPAPADFLLGPGGVSGRCSTWRDVAGITWNQQTRVPGRSARAGERQPPRLVPGAVGQVAFGRYVSPDYETAEKFIPPVGTRTGTPAVAGVNEVYFNLFLPPDRCPRVAGRWRSSATASAAARTPARSSVAASMASQGIATIAINVVGHGFGPLSTLTVRHDRRAPVTFPQAGAASTRTATESSLPPKASARPRRSTIIRDRDGQRQTVADLMQLVRVIEVGMDVDGDGVAGPGPVAHLLPRAVARRDLRHALLAVEPSVRAGALNVPGGPFSEILHLSPVFRPQLGAALFARIPSLLNAGRPTRPPTSSRSSTTCRCGTSRR